MKLLNADVRVAFSVFLFILLSGFNSLSAQQSVARQWSEVMLDCIRHDYVRPAVQARTVAHVGWAMYDAWAVYDDQAAPYILGNDLGFYTSEFNGVFIPEDVVSAQEKALSYAVFRVLIDRFQNNAPPGEWENYILPVLTNKMLSLGYDPEIGSIEYNDGDPAKMGNYIATQIINLGNLDGTNEENNFANNYYFSVNGNIWPELPGNPQCDNPNRWQPISIQLQYDEFGQPYPLGEPAQNVEWGNAIPFALTPDDASIRFRDNQEWKVYLDPGQPPLLDVQSQTGFENPYKWGFIANIVFQSYHGSNPGGSVDIAPSAMGNAGEAPSNPNDMPSFYELGIGGPANTGYALNPFTGQPYEPQVVPRSDYTRSISEYWYNGPDNETPAGHWIRLFNQASDSPFNTRRWQGSSEELSPLEWDVKSYFAIGGGLYDAAIACWSAKGYYDFIRPVMAIRFMCELGQSTSSSLPNYHPGGMPLIPGRIELIEPGDPLALQSSENIGKIKLFTWQGQPDDPQSQTSGNGWILGERWMPYQKESVVSPSYPGYYSEHSALSRSAAEIMGFITGSEFFPGGLAGHFIPENVFLQVENGPSRDLTLQWAKYKDAADQSGLSAVYGGINTPFDDVIGRQIGATVGQKAFAFANDLISVGAPHVVSISFSDELISDTDAGSVFSVTVVYSRPMNPSNIPQLSFPLDNPIGTTLSQIGGVWLNESTYRADYLVNESNETLSNIRVKVDAGIDNFSNEQVPAQSGIFRIDTQNPTATINLSTSLVNDIVNGSGAFSVEVFFNEPMSDENFPQIEFFGSDQIGNVIQPDFAQFIWISETNFIAYYNVADINVDLGSVSVKVSGVRDQAQNGMITFTQNNAFIIDNLNPSADISTGDLIISDVDVANGFYTMTITFSEAMNTFILPQIGFSNQDPSASVTFNNSLSSWPSSNVFNAVFNVSDQNDELTDITVNISGALDSRQNPMIPFSLSGIFRLDTSNPVIVNAFINQALFNDSDTGDDALIVHVEFDQQMDVNDLPQIELSGSDLIGQTFVLNEETSVWINNLTYEAHFDMLDDNIELTGISAAVVSAFDDAGNALSAGVTIDEEISVDTKNPEILSFTLSDNLLTENEEGTVFSITVVFDQPMNTSLNPVISFPAENPLTVLTENTAGGWLSAVVYKQSYTIGDITQDISDIDFMCSLGQDPSGNTQVEFLQADQFNIDAVVSVSESGSESLYVFPNPASSARPLFVAGISGDEKKNIDILDRTGRVVSRKSGLQLTGSMLVIDVNDLAAGVYFLRINSKSADRHVKFIITE